MPEDRFPALSVRQPWADLIVWGYKDVENRSFRTHFRGTILIHASAAKPDPGLVARVEATMHEHGILPKGEPYRPTCGGIVGMIDIVDSVTVSDSGWFEGPHGWVLDRPVSFRQMIPYKGAVGIFYVPRKRLAGTAATRRKPGRSVR